MYCPYLNQNKDIFVLFVGGMPKVSLLERQGMGGQSRIMNGVTAILRLGLSRHLLFW